VLSQYVEHLIQKNGQHQQDLLSNIQIAHMEETTSAESGASLSPYSDEKKNYRDLIEQTVIEEKVKVKKIELPKEEYPLPLDVLSKESIPTLPLPVEKITTLPVVDSTDSREGQALQKESIRKMIAEEFYKCHIGTYIDPMDIKSQVEKRLSTEIDIEDIHDVAWVLIAQDVLEFTYWAICKNGHDVYQQPPLPKKITCSTCLETLANIKRAYKKLA
jgi:hypothetical protein